MSDDSPFPPDKRKTPHPNSLANLIKSKPGDPPLNPTGKNGRTRAEYVAAFLDKADDTDLGKALVQKVGLPADTSRIDALLQRDFIAAMGKSEQARKLLIEQYGGRAKQQIDVSNPDGSLAGPKVVAYLPTNGRGPLMAQTKEPEPEQAPVGQPDDEPGST